MTDMSINSGSTPAPLGVGSIIGESFKILFGNLIAVMLLCVAPILLSLLISGVSIGWSLTLGGAAVGGVSAPPGPGAFAVSTILNLVITGILTALVVQLAYDAKLGRPTRLGSYFGPALRAAIPIAVLSLVASLLVGVALIALIIPGLWVYAVFSVMAPAVTLEEGVGFKGLGRSAALTKGYRWPIIGAIILAGIAMALFLFAVGLVVDLAAAATGGGLILPLVLYALLTTISSGFSGILVSLIYARLREIKEGVGLDQIVSVFE